MLDTQAHSIADLQRAVEHLREVAGAANHTTLTDVDIYRRSRRR
jgi:hypothetical protein